MFGSEHANRYVDGGDKGGVSPLDSLASSAERLLGLVGAFASVAGWRLGGLVGFMFAAGWLFFPVATTAVRRVHRNRRDVYRKAPCKHIT
jgi:hypothetical protein